MCGKWGQVSEAYTIDAWGNLTNRAPAPGMTGNCTAETLNAAPASSQNHLQGFSYDIAGNVLNDGNGNTPTYDAENRIATDAGVTYDYDADGLRMEKSSGTMYWPGPSGEYLAETDLTGTINEEYIYFNGERIARVDRPSGTVHYYFSDHLHSASVITDANGNVQEQYFYYPYGGIVSSTGTDPNHYKFNGKERDTESNLDEFGARYYASALGRFMTPDWADKATDVPYANFGNPQSLNLYSYVENNPTTTGDPDGHCSVNPTTGAGGTDCGEEVPNFPLVKKDTTPPEQNTPPWMPNHPCGSQGCYWAGNPNQSDSTGGHGFWWKLGNALGIVKDPVVVAGAGLAPGANGPAQAAKDAAKNFMKSKKPDPPLRGLPGEDPNITKMSKERELAKKALDTLGGIGASLANGATEVMVPLLVIPDVVVHPNRVPGEPDCNCT